MQNDIESAQSAGSFGAANTSASAPSEEPNHNTGLAVHSSPAAVAPPESVASPALSAVDDKPVPVVKVFSVRGMEYLFMTIALFFGAVSVVSILLAAINDQANFEVLAFPLSLLIVSLPIFALLFIRLRKAELKDPSLRLEASKRRASQFSQFVTFFTCLFTLVTLVNLVLNSVGGSYEGSLGKAFLNGLVVLVVAGGIFVYYWFDEHKLVK